MKRYLLLACLLAPFMACATLPAKQDATLKLQGVENLLGTAQDTERALCSAVADKTQPITHCDNPAAATVGLTDARHQAIARAFATAFGVQVKAAIALQAWKAGDPVPSDLVGYSTDANAVLALARQLSGSPDVAKVTTALQQAIQDLAAISATLKGQ